MSNPLYAASHVQNLANRASNDRLAFVLTGLSVALIGMMVAKEGCQLIKDLNRKEKRHFER